MLHTREALLHTARASLALALGLGLVAGCFVDTLEAVPAYPGSSIGPGYRQKDDGRTSLKQIYYTPDGYHQVVEYYGRYVNESGVWEEQVSGDLAIWKQNMQLDSLMTNASPIDPAKPGKLIVVVNEGTRTTIRAYSSHPGT